jgi:2-amino-4-hydroxy-6-hydroxymethyldihydropteridine diphosphokinase
MERAIRLIERLPLHINQVSSLYETEPWGDAGSVNFYNAAIELNTGMTPLQLLEKLQRIEMLCGRRPSIEKYAPRPIDIDILCYGEIVVSSDLLRIPHPWLPFRRFVLIPLAEIAPFYVHPLFSKTFADMLAICTDGGQVKIICSWNPVRRHYS